LTLIFMLWLAPVRRGAAIAILGSACLVGLFVLSFTFVPHSLQMFPALRHAAWGEVDLGRLVQAGSYRLIGHFYWDNSAPVLLLLLVSLIAYAVWPRTRYFGTTAPFLAAVLCVFLSLIMPRTGGVIFLFVSLPLLYVFIAGVFTDLLETRYSTAIGVRQLTHLTR